MKRQTLRIKKGFPLFLFLGVLIWSLSAFSLPVFAGDSLSLTSEKTEVKAGETVTVSVHLSGSEIWAYQIELSANEMFFGEETFIKDYDGSDSVTLSASFYAAAPGNGEIYAEASYSDGDKLVRLKSTALQIRVEEEGGTSAAKREGTGGQAAPGQNINGTPQTEGRESIEPGQEQPEEETPEEGQEESQNDPEEESGQEAEHGKEEADPSGISEEETEQGEELSDTKENGSKPASEEQAVQQKNNSTLLWVLIAAGVVVLGIGIAALLIAGKRKKKK